MGPMVFEPNEIYLYYQGADVRSQFQTVKGIWVVFGYQKGIFIFINVDRYNYVFIITWQSLGEGKHSLRCLGQYSMASCR